MMSPPKMTGELDAALDALALRLFRGENRDGNVNGAVSELSERTGHTYLFLKATIEARAGEMRQRRGSMTVLGKESV